MAHRRTFTQRAKPVNRHWTGFGQGFLAFSAGTNAALVNMAIHGRETLLRIRGELSAWMDTTSVPPLAVQIGIGLILVPEGTGSTVLWSPLTDIDAPWFWYETFLLAYEEMVTDVVDVPGMTSFRKTIDSKAMRIVRPDVELQLVVENVTLAGAAAVNVHAGGRILSQQ